MLTHRKKQFIVHYISDIERNGTRAAKEAGYSPKTAYSQANRLLKDVDVKAEIARLDSIACAESKITKENALKMLWSQAQDTNNKPNDRIRAVEVLSKIKKWHKDSDGNRIAVFQQIEKDMRDTSKSVMKEVRDCDTLNTRHA